MTKKECRAIAKKWFLSMLHPEGTIEADMIKLLNEVSKLRKWK